MQCTLIGVKFDILTTKNAIPKLMSKESSTEFSCKS